MCLGAPVRKSLPNETALVLLVAALFSAGAIALLSGFLEPSQPPGVGAVKIGEPRNGVPAADDAAAKEQRATPQAPADEGRPEKASERLAQPAPSPSVDDAGEDDGGEAD
jgi:hypothetical protein